MATWKRRIKNTFYRNYRRLGKCSFTAVLLTMGMILGIGLTPCGRVFAAPEGSQEDTADGNYASYAVLNLDKDSQAPGVYADGYILLDMNDNSVICERQADERFRPASTTKIMTALVVLDRVENLDAELTFSHNAVTDISKDSSTLIPKAQEGETMTVRDVLYGMMLCSGNECAYALAEYVAGSTAAFAELMNEKAAAIGCVNTHFANPHGLDADEHYTTPRDLAIIFEEAMKYPAFVEIDTSVHYTIPKTNKTDERVCEMGHRMMNGTYTGNCEGVIAGKTGQTKLAKRVLVTLCEREGRQVLAIIMHSTEEQFYHDTEVLLDYAYNRIHNWVLPYQYEEMKPQEMEVNEYINIYQYDNYFSDVLMTTNPGDHVTQIATWWIWSRVKIGEVEGFMESSWLTPIKEEPKPSQTPSEEMEDPTSDIGVSQSDSITESKAPVEIENNISEASLDEESAAVISQEKESKGGMPTWFYVCSVILVLCLIGEGVLFVIFQRRYR